MSRSQPIENLLYFQESWSSGGHRLLREWVQAQPGEWQDLGLFGPRD